MAIYLDYYMRSREEGILIIAIRDENDMFWSYGEADFDEAISVLASRDLIVVYERPLFNVIAMAEEQGLKHYIEDFDIRERWIDLFTIIRKETGKAPSFSSVARSTLGTGPQSKVTRLGEVLSPKDDPQIIKKLEERTDILKQMHLYAVQHGQLSFETRDETTWLEVAVSE